MERRNGYRLPVELFLTQYISDKPYRGIVTNIGANGLLLNRLVEPVEYNSNLVQLELSLPGTTDTIWVLGEIVYDRFISFFHQYGIKFKEMASFERKLLEEWLKFARVELIRNFLDRVTFYKRQGASFKYKKLKIVRDLRGDLQVLVY